MDTEPEWIVLDNEGDYWAYSKGEVCESRAGYQSVSSLSFSVYVNHLFDPIEHHLEYFDDGEPEQMSLPYVFLR